MVDMREQGDILGHLQEVGPVELADKGLRVQDAVRVEVMVAGVLVQVVIIS